MMWLNLIVLASLLVLIMNDAVTKVQAAVAFLVYIFVLPYLGPVTSVLLAVGLIVGAGISYQRSGQFNIGGNVGPVRGQVGGGVQLGGEFGVGGGGEV